MLLPLQYLGEGLVVSFPHVMVEREIPIRLHQHHSVMARGASMLCCAGSARTWAGGANTAHGGRTGERRVASGQGRGGSRARRSFPALAGLALRQDGPGVRIHMLLLRRALGTLVPVVNTPHAHIGGLAMRAAVESSHVAPHGAN